MRITFAVTIVLMKSLNVHIGLKHKDIDKEEDESWMMDAREEVNERSSECVCVLERD